MALHNWFLPNRDTHQKAKLISWEALLFYILIFILLQVSFSIAGYVKPGVLGITSNIDQNKLIELTNKEREKLGLSPVSENPALDKAAVLKAQNMFSENYWAHFAPSGKTPWDFILGAGYKFTYAGENLAKNFYGSDKVVSAWMASPTHKENLLNPKYQDIGIAVVEGVLNGQRTTLIVQMFGTTQSIQGAPQIKVGGQELTIPKAEYIGKSELLATISENPFSGGITIDSSQIIKGMGLSVVALMIVLLGADIIVLRKRGVFRISSRHFAHMSILSIAAAAMLSVSSGSIL